MTRRAILAGAVTLAVAGCGPTSPSMSRLRSQAGAVCARTLTRDAAIQPPADPAATATFLRRGLAVLRPELADLRTLRVPNEASGPYSAALHALEREVTILSGTVHDLDRGADPLTTIKTLQHRLAPVEADENAAWRTLDVPACANR